MEGDGRGTWMMVVVLMSGVTLGPHERVTGWKRGREMTQLNERM